MVNYDFQKAKRYIQMHSDLIEEAALGMHEDWFWTAESIYRDGQFCVDLDYPNLQLGGISGSPWATPMLEVRMKDGKEIQKPCYVGDVTGERPEWFQLGILSQAVQDEREPKLTLIKSETEA